MRIRLTLLILLFLAAIGLAYAGGNREQAPEPQPEPVPAAEEPTGPATRIGVGDSDRFVARVNGVGILRSDFDNAVQVTIQRFAMQGQTVQEPDIDQLRAEVLEQLIAEELLYQDALARSLTLNKTQVDQQFQQIRDQFSTEEQWNQALEQNNTTAAELREQIERNSLIQQVIATVVGQTPPEVTTAEIRTFYDDNPEFFATGEQVAARHILVSTQGLSGEDIDDARAAAQQIRQELIDGADFAELARERSDDPGAAAQGGDLGTFGRGMMVPEFEEAAFSLEVGEISQLVQTQFGFHIVQVTERIAGGMTPLAQVTENIRQYLSQQKQAEALDVYIDSLREQAEITVNA
ncbi:MAG: hypothetical protein EA382_14555 [Spirochaetaceae bacterium]|nr:MAG: hypothetical protein EA382_14555 [Spirochaetaceae bacterium]